MKALKLAALAAAIAAGAPALAQQDYPNKPVRWINPFPAGGATDTLSRLFCAKMAELTNQQWLVENKGGSGGNVGMEVVAQAAPDGHTLLMSYAGSHAINPALYKKLPFDPVKDFSTIALLGSAPLTTVVQKMGN